MRRRKGHATFLLQRMPEICRQAWGTGPDIEHQFSLWREATLSILQLVEMQRNSDHSGGNTTLSLSRRNEMRAFIKRFLMHYGIYRRYPLGWFPALRNAWRAAQP
jgi:hypothetical protein